MNAGGKNGRKGMNSKKEIYTVKERDRERQTDRQTDRKTDRKYMKK